MIFRVDTTHKRLHLMDGYAIRDLQEIIETYNLQGFTITHKREKKSMCNAHYPKKVVKSFRNPKEVKLMPKRDSKGRFLKTQK